MISARLRIRLPEKSRVIGIGKAAGIILAGELLIFLLEIICYDDFLWMIPLQLLMIPYIRSVRQIWWKHRQHLYLEGFREMLQSMMTSLQAGYSVENAFRAALEELKELYGSGGHPIIDELEKIVNGLSLHRRIDSLFTEFALRTEIEDICEFAAVLQIACSTGGNIVDILKDAMEHLQKKMEMMEEIEVMLSGKLFEKNIMLMMPFIILIYMRLTNTAYMAKMYHSLLGSFIMTVMIVAVLGCYYWTERIMDLSC